MKSQTSNLKLIVESCARQLRGWADHLQNSEIKGQRHLTEKVRQAEQRRRAEEAFWEETTRIVELARQQRTGQSSE